jgi:hypothetical protein
VSNAKTPFLNIPLQWHNDTEIYTLTALFFEVPLYNVAGYDVIGKHKFQVTESVAQTEENLALRPETRISGRCCFSLHQMACSQTIRFRRSCAKVRNSRLLYVAECRETVLTGRSLEAAG